MFFTTISKFHSPWYLSLAFQLNVGCFSTRPCIMGIICTDVAAFTGFPIFDCHYCRFGWLYGYLCDCWCHNLFGCHSMWFCLWVSSVSLFLLLSLSCLRLLAFYFWYHVMLLTLKEDIITGSFCVCCLLCVLSIIIKSGMIYTSLHLCTIIICTNGMAVYMYPCTLLLFLVYIISPQRWFLLFIFYTVRHWY